jgi:hypothetical protein
LKFFWGILGVLSKGAAVGFFEIVLDVVWGVWYNGIRFENLHSPNSGRMKQTTPPRADSLGVLSLKEQVF